MTVGLVIVSHSAQLAAGVVELAGQMTQGKTPIAAAGGAIDDILGTSADKILEAITICRWTRWCAGLVGPGECHSLC